MTLYDKPQDAERLLAEDHAALAELLDGLIASLNAGDATEAFARLDLIWARLAIHIRAENLHLFPSILNVLEAGSSKGEDVSPSLAEANEAIARLGIDHNFFMHELADLIKTMREVQLEPFTKETTKQLSAVRQRIVSLGTRLEKHNELEEELVYRWPGRLLDESQRALLTEQVRRQIENFPPRFNSSRNASEKDADS